MWKPCRFIALTEKKCKALSRISWVYHFSMCLYHLFSWAVFSLWSKENLELVSFFLKSRDLLALQTHIYLAHSAFAVFAQPSDTQQQEPGAVCWGKEGRAAGITPRAELTILVSGVLQGLVRSLPRTVQVCVFNKALWYSLGFDNIPTLQHLQGNCEYLWDSESHSLREKCKCILYGEL